MVTILSEEEKKKREEARKAKRKEKEGTGVATKTDPGFIRKREKRIAELGGTRGAEEQARRDLRLGGVSPVKPESQTVEEVQAERARFEEEARAAGVLGAPIPQTPPLEDVFDTSQTAGSIQDAGTLFKDQGAIGAILAINRANKEKIMAATDGKLVNLGFGVGAGAAILATGALSALFIKPILSLFDFNKEAKTLTAAIPDHRETLDKLISAMNVEAFSPTQTLIRIDDIEDKVAEIEINIRLAAAKSSTINSSGEAEAVLSRLGKFKVDLQRAKATAFQAQQVGLTGATPEQVADFLAELQREEDNE